VRRPTILHVLEAFAGGTERHLLDVVRHAQGFEHVLAVPPRHLGRSTERACALARAAGAQMELVDMPRGPDLGAITALGALVRRVRPDIVHGHSSIGGALARVAAAGSGVPVVYTPHGVSRARWALAVERSLRGRTHRLIAVSESERAFALEHRLVSPERVRVIPNGIELEAPPAHRSLRAALGVGPGVPLVGCVARLTWQKAPEIFVEACGNAARRLPQARFVLIGSGPQRRLVEHAALSCGLNGNFQLLDGLDDAAGALSELDVFVLPSRFEGAPYTPLEAMRAGVAVVVSDADGNRDTVTPGVSGLIVPREDPLALAEAIVHLVEDLELRERLVAGALSTLPEFDVRRMASALEGVYAELLAGRRPRLAGRERRVSHDRRRRLDRRALEDRRASRDRRGPHERCQARNVERRRRADRRREVDRRARLDRRRHADRRASHHRKPFRAPFRR
jgi:glycosyltransferase involved in cell wall biosynthesis